MKSLFILPLLVSLIVPVASAQVNGEAGNDAARNLVEKVLDRYMGNTEVSRMSLVTCAYRDKGDSIGCSSAPRRKTVQSISKMYGQKLKDSRGLMLILEPVAEYGIGILQYDYVESGADSDQWMYLPELDQVKRIASSNDAPKKGSLFGSEFSLEDMERQKLNEYTYKIIGKETINGEELVKVEHVPTKARAPKSNYAKRIQWIDEARLLVIKEEYYELSGELFKVKTSSDLVESDDIWTAKKVMMRNLKTRRVSMLLYADVTYNLPIQDEALTPRILSDAVFRENFIKSLRQEKPAAAMPVARQ
ncbi:outer membrane lipoprotein-sorting protein [Cellvibrio mixtus]|uniref:outer membrane lipoprotein-sorting protein n=1 Tax=Cellvibrio mixtus TaxID=39650 RepID=UPI0006945EA1|nr:outer membrane lipoprotein-sorting protein [Cellvibrio mixtus]